MEALSRLSTALWYPWLLGLFLLTGLVYSLGSGFFQLFGIRRWFSTTAGSLFRRDTATRSGLSPARALAAALASTLGTGSIAGVAAALTLGGPGTVFWMWISALLGMMTGCGEKLLSVLYQRPAPGGGLQGGPMFYIRDGAGLPGAALLFSLACLPAALTGGDLIQAASIADGLEAAFGLDRLCAGAVTALLAGVVMAGGIRQVAKASAVLVPVMAVLYLGCGAVVLICRASELPRTLRLILTSALSPGAVAGGCGGWSVITALHWGVARGVFTNEAGLGTSAMAHGAAEVSHPAVQGMWGIFETALSTLVVCTVTALVILVSEPWNTAGQCGLTGAALTSAAFGSVLGRAGEAVTALSLLLFAFSSILGWSCYGQQALRFLPGGDRLLPVYRLIFLACIPAGTLLDGKNLWSLVDLFNALMAFPNLTALILLAPRALSVLNTWLKTSESV